MDRDFINALQGINAVKQEVLKDDQGRFLAVIKHEDSNVECLDNLNPSPRQLVATETFSRVNAFIDYLKKFKLDNTVIFSNLEKLTIGANINYHRDSKMAEWNKHHANLVMKLDKDFIAWQALDGKIMSHGLFKNFLLDYQADFLIPDRAVILELIAGLKSKSGAELDSVVGNLSTQEIMNKTFNVKSAAGDIPDVFSIALPVIEGFGKYALDFRLVFVEKDGGGFGVKVQLIRPHLIIEQVFNDVVGDIADQAKVEILGNRQAPAAK